MRFKITIFIIFGFLININLYCQKKVEKIDNLLSAKNKFKNIDSLLMANGLHRDFESNFKFGIQEQVYTFKKRHNPKDFKLAILSAKINDQNGINDVLLYYEIFQDYYSWIVYSSNIDTFNINMILKKYREYGLQMLDPKFEMTYGQIDCKTLGYACGFSASMPYLGTQLRPLLIDNNLNEIFKWIESINPTRQAYGYLGIQILCKKSISLTEEQQKKLIDFENDINNKYYYIRACSGCYDGDGTFLKDFPNSEILKTLISQYSRE